MSGEALSDGAVERWLDSFARAVRDVDYAAARALFDGEVIAFGTVTVRAAGIAELEAAQWRAVWGVTSGFRFETDDLRIGHDGSLAWVAARWSSKGVAPDGGTLDRRGRATLVLRRDPDGLRAIHSHFSFEPGWRG